MRSRKARTRVLTMLCCLLVFMGVGFAVSRTVLNIGGTSTALNTWSVYIESITTKSSSGATSKSAEVDETTKTAADLSVEFTKPGDYIEYEVTVVNNGSLDATLNGVSVNITTESESDASLFNITNTSVAGTPLKAGESTTFTVRIDYKLEAEALPEEEVKFEVMVDLVQGDGTGSGEGPGQTPEEPEVDWDFEVDEDGTITAYNYDLGTDVVVPATNYEGKAITAITDQSFMQQGNVYMYMNESPMGMYGVILEDEPNFTYAKEKLVTMFTMECEGDTTCVEQYKSMMYACKDENTCYNVSNEEQHKADPSVELVVTPLPDAVESQGGGYINPDPNVSLEESMADLNANVTSLDLSSATNLTTIGEDAFYNNQSDITGTLVIPEGVTTIGNYAFQGNAIEGLVIPDSLETIGNSAFYGNQIEELTIGTTTEVENQLNRNNKYQLSRLGTNIEKLATSNSKLKSIGNSAFYNNKIKSLVLPDSIQIVGSSAFSFNQISTLEIPDSLTTIEASAFYNNKISQLYFPRTVTKLGSGAFTGNPFDNLTIEYCTTNICVGAYYSGNSYFGNQIKTLTIESGEIGEYAFYGYNSAIKIESLTLGEGVTQVGSYAFYGNSIEGLVIPSTLTIIESSTFENSQINKLTISSGVTLIGEYAFQNNAITTLEIPSTLITIKSSAFNENQISTLTFAEASNLTTIESYAFSNNAITELHLPSGITTIESYAFQNNAIRELELPSELITIKSSVFSSNQIRELTFAENSQLTTIEAYAFCDNALTELELPSGITTIESYAFGNNDISRMYLPASVTSIGYSAFSGSPLDNLIIEKCTLSICAGDSTTGSYYFGNQIKTLTIESGEIGWSAFSSTSDSTTKIESLILGEGVTQVGAYAFQNNAISELYFPKTVISLGTNAFSNNPLDNLIIEKCTTHICGGTIDSGNSYFGNEIKTLTIESGEIGGYAFKSASDSTTKIESLTLGEGVTIIWPYAFQNNAIVELELPTTLTTIGGNSFENNSISELYLPKTVTSLGNDAFKGNSFDNLTIEKCTTSICAGTFSTGNSYFGKQIKNLTIGSGEIGDYAFTSKVESTTKIEKLTLGEGVTTIGDYAFDSNQISSLTIPNGVASIGDSAFFRNQISSVTFAENSQLTTIGSFAFYENQINSLTLPNGVITIENYAFQNNQIISLTISSSVATIGSYAFSGNQISGELILPNGLTTIGNSAFDGNQISGLTIPPSVTSIGQMTFQHNQISGELIIPNSVTTIGLQAFLHNQISSLVIPSSVISIGQSAFSTQEDSESNHTLTSILIKRTEEDFLANVTVSAPWYDNSLSPTITYQPDVE